MNLYSFANTHPIVPYIRESDFAVRSAYYSPFRKLLDYLLIYIRKGELTVVADGTNHPHDLDWIPSYFSFHLAETLCIQDLAKRTNLSPSRFRAVFRERFGAPPHQFLINLRLDHAKERLSSTTYSIAKIAEYCGFSDVSHFTNMFRSREGLSPGAFRGFTRV